MIGKLILLNSHTYSRNTDFGPVSSNIVTEFITETDDSTRTPSLSMKKPGYPLREHSACAGNTLKKRRSDLTSRWFALEVTRRCNLDCGFCYNPPGSVKELEPELYGVIADSIGYGEEGVGVTLTGGEPLMRADLEHIASTFYSRGFPVAVATNGTLLTDERTRSLVASGVSHFDIGFTNPSHETVMALTHVVRTGATVTASLCITGNNHHLTGVRVRTAAALGADSVCLNRFIPTGRGKHGAKALIPHDEQLLNALEQAQSAIESCPVHVYTGIPVEPELADSHDFPGIEFTTCRCGDTKWAVDPAGNLRTCEQSERSLGNLLEISFSEALKIHSVEIREFRRTSARGCRFLG